jgi:hypothetical protein
LFSGNKIVAIASKGICGAPGSKSQPNKVIIIFIEEVLPFRQELRCLDLILGLKKCLTICLKIAIYA